MLTLLRSHGRYRAVFDAGSVYVIHTIAGQNLEATEMYLCLLATQATDLADHCHGRIERRAARKLKSSGTVSRLQVISAQHPSMDCRPLGTSVAV